MKVTFLATPSKFCQISNKPKIPIAFQISQSGKFLPNLVTQIPLIFLFKQPRQVFLFDSEKYLDRQIICLLDFFRAGFAASSLSLSRGRRGGEWCQRWPPFLKQLFFLKMGHSRPLFVIFVFSNKHYNFLANICEKCPSSWWCWDLNPRPSGHESPPTRPGLPPLKQLFLPTFKNGSKINWRL